MPPRGRGGGGRGRGGPTGPPAAGRGGVPASAAAGGAHVPASHVQAIGVRRPLPGTSGRRIVVTSNHYDVDVATSIIHHYDGSFLLDYYYLLFTRRITLSRHIV